MNNESKEYFMNQALEQAEVANRHNEVPVGAVVVRDNDIIGAGYNRVINESDPSAHAEISAMREAGQKTKNYRLTGSDTWYSCSFPLPETGAVWSLMLMLQRWWVNGIGIFHQKTVLTKTQRFGHCKPP